MVVLDYAQYIYLNTYLVKLNNPTQRKLNNPTFVQLTKK